MIRLANLITIQSDLPFWSLPFIHATYLNSVGCWSLILVFDERRVLYACGFELHKGSYQDVPCWSQHMPHNSCVGMCVCAAKDYAEFLILSFPVLTCTEYE
jgi:hypothetical protein